MSDLKGLMLASPRLTLAVAESLTSGRLQAEIGAISGASTFFLGGITAYSTDEKVRLLGIDRAEAEAVNCVSSRVAEQMACGVCRLFGSDLGVATTGYAEPYPDRRIEMPFAFWGLARRLPGGDFAVSSGRVDCPGLSRSGCRSAWQSMPSAPLSRSSGRDLLHKRHERLHLGGRRYPVAVEELGHRVGRGVEREIGGVVALDVPGLDGGAREKAHRL